MVKAEYVSDTKVLCKTPPFCSRQLDNADNSNQAGSAKNPHTKVQVTNTGALGWSDNPKGHLSQNPHLEDDGSKSYIHTFSALNTYTSGASSNPFRSTCQAGLYPNEGMKPCWDAHTINSEGNDVLFKYATCYDSQSAGLVPSLDLYSGTVTGQKAVNATSSLGQQITITATNDELRVQCLFQHTSIPQARHQVLPAAQACERCQRHYVEVHGQHWRILRQFGQHDLWPIQIEGLHVRRLR